jgi:hypothetical protein
MVDTVALIASFIAILSLFISILNYYKSLEPALSIRIDGEKRMSKTPLPEYDYITKIIFKNASNNKFDAIDIFLAFIASSPQPNSSWTSTMFLPDLYLGPQDERIVSFPSSTGDVNYLRYANDQQTAKLNIKYSYKFLFQKKSYEADFRWNPRSQIWDWSLTIR